MLMELGFGAMSVVMLLWGLLTFLVTLWVIYDVVVEQDGMEPLEKLVWVLAVLFLNLIGVVLYVALVKYRGEQLLSSSRAAQLERLADLRDRGALSEEEFQEEKRTLLDGTDNGGSIGSGKENT